MSTRRCENAARVIEAEYEWPFQSHACMGPACAVVEIKDGHVTCWSGSQKPHFVRDGIARTLELPMNKVDCIWVVGPGSYGRNDADDCAMDAAVLARLTGKPVRLQYTREQGTGWDPKGPASIHRARAAIDAVGQGRGLRVPEQGLLALRCPDQRQPAAPIRSPAISAAFRSRSTTLSAFRRNPTCFDNKRTAWETIGPFLDRASPLRSAHLRDPVGPQIHFASESFMDEVAAGLGIDPIELRLLHVKDPRDAAVLRAAAEKSGWVSRVSPRKDQTGTTVTGRGIAYSQRNGTTCAIVAEVDIDRRSGKIWARKFTVAHDCGQIINPDGLAHTIEGNIIQGISRTLWEEVQVRRQERDQHRLADLSDPRHHRDAADDRLRLHQPAGDRAHRRRRAVDPSGGGGDRQRDLRCDRRAHAPRAVLARPGEGGVRVSLPLILASVTRPKSETSDSAGGQRLSLSSKA